MSNMTVRRGIAVVLLPTILRIAGAAHLNPGQGPKAAGIHIRLVDMAGLPEKMRTQAEASVLAIFRMAGLELDFVECPAAGAALCSEAPGKAEFWLQILKQRPSHLHQDSTGFAILVPSPQSGDSYAAVSFPMVESAARNLEAPVADVLAASM